MARFGDSAASAFFTGTLTAAVADRFDVGLAGHTYVLDRKNPDEFRRESVQLIRQQADSSERPGEQTINPDGLWRRSTESWHHGAGQSWLDRLSTDPFRFSASKGLDPWTPYALSPLPDTSRSAASSNTNLFLVPSGGRLYSSDGTGINVTAVGGTTLSAATGTPAVAVTSLTSDGSTVYAGFGASGIYIATGSAFASSITGAVALVRYVKGRLLATNGGAVYNPIAPGALPAALYTHPNASWTWTDITEGVGHIFLAGSAGDRSIIYKTAVKQDGSALDIPVVAGELPDGELATSLTGYLGFLVIGTNKGVRFAAIDTNGFLTLGALIPTGSPVLCGEGQDRFVWYGLTNYDAAATGLGRLDLSTFTSDLTPAYASDLMAASTQGSVVSVATYLGKRWFTVSGSGIWRELDTKVASGTVTSGRIGFGLHEQKSALYVTVRHDKLDAAESVTVLVAVNNGTVAPVGVSDVDGSSEPAGRFELTNVVGDDFEVTVTFAGDVTLRSFTLQADPSADRTDYIYVPVMLRDSIDAATTPVAVDVLEEWLFLTELRDSRRVVTYQEGEVSQRVVVDDTQWRPDKKTHDGRFYQGTYLLKLKGV